MKKIKRKKVIKIIKKIVSENPEKTVPASECVYFHENEPSCLVGFVFEEIGLNREKFLEMFPGGNVKNVKDLELEELFSAGAEDALISIQYFQDTGLSWIRSLSESEKRSFRLRTAEYEYKIGSKYEYYDD
jgi:hypothetical protein